MLEKNQQGIVCLAVEKNKVNAILVKQSALEKKLIEQEGKQVRS